MGALACVRILVAWAGDLAALAGELVACRVALAWARGSACALILAAWAGAMVALVVALALAGNLALEGHCMESWILQMASCQSSVSLHCQADLQARQAHALSRHAAEPQSFHLMRSQSQCSEGPGDLEQGIAAGAAAQTLEAFLYRLHVQN
jgi:hypothetical protein